MMSLSYAALRLGWSSPGKKQVVREGEFKVVDIYIECRLET